MTSFIKRTYVTIATLFIPYIVSAQIRATTYVSGVNPADVSEGNKNLAYLIDLIAHYLNLVLYLLMGFAVVAFVFYIVRYFIMPNDDRKQAGLYVLYSVIGFFVILSFWGLVNIVQNTFGLTNQTSNWQSVQSIFPRR